MTCSVVGYYSWEGERDDEGYRTYKLVTRIKGAIGSGADGPANVLQTPGLPLPGAIWSLAGDLDIWAWCRWDAKVTPELYGEPNAYWRVEQTFSTRPPGQYRNGGGRPDDNRRSGCRDFRFESPLTEPPKVSFGFIKYTEEATHDKDGFGLEYTTHEPIRGPLAEFDATRFFVRIEQNIPVANLSLHFSMRDCLNKYPLWGFPARSIKLTEFTAPRQYYGSCYLYYARVLAFEVRLRRDTEAAGPGTSYVGDWDRLVLNASGQALLGHHAPSGSGSGCIVSITSIASDGTGRVTGVSTTPDAGGSGYPTSSRVALTLAHNAGDSDKNGSDLAVVVGRTNGNGAVVELPNDANGSNILYGGAGYNNNLGFPSTYLTYGGVTWTVDSVTKISDGWTYPNPDNPQHYTAYIDHTGNAARAPMNHAGVPLALDEPKVYVKEQKYDEADFLLLGIPAVIE